MRMCFEETELDGGAAVSQERLNNVQEWIEKTMQEVRRSSEEEKNARSRDDFDKVSAEEEGTLPKGTPEATEPTLHKDYRQYLRMHGSDSLCARHGLSRFTVQQAKWKMGNAWRMWDTGEGKPEWAQNNWGESRPGQGGTACVGS